MSDQLGRRNGGKWPFDELDMSKAFWLGVLVAPLYWSFPVALLLVLLGVIK